MAHPVRIRTATGWQELALVPVAGPPGPPGGQVYQQLLGDGSASAFAVTHGFGIRGVAVTVFRSELPYDEVLADVEHTDLNSVTVRLLKPPELNELTVFVSAPGSPPGGGGGDLSYVHTQSPLSTSWTVTHNLGKYPSVEIVDSGGNIVIPDVHYIDTNSLTVTFSTPTSGKVYLN